ncbi:L-ascorbate peroxidase 3 [Bienertia sinuspersici]
MAMRVVDTDYLKEIDKAHCDLHFLISIRNCAPIMLRLAWHDAGTYCAKTNTSGPNGSIRNEEECAHGANNDVINKFKDENGSFKEYLIEDVPGLISLYEASHVRVHDDNSLVKGHAFSITNLNAMVSLLRSPIADEVSRTLHQPLHKGPRVESRHYIFVHEMHPSYNKTLLKFT